MPDQPLKPFNPPVLLLLQHVPGSLSAGIAMEWLLYFVFAVWTVYTVVIIFHWLKYSHGSWLAFPSIAAHLFVSLALMSYALTGTSAYFSSYLP